MATTPLTRTNRRVKIAKALEGDIYQFESKFTRGLRFSSFILYILDLKKKKKTRHLFTKIDANVAVHFNI